MILLSSGGRQRQCTGSSNDPVSPEVAAAAAEATLCLGHSRGFMCKAAVTVMSIYGVFVGFEAKSTVHYSLYPPH